LYGREFGFQDGHCRWIVVAKKLGVMAGSLQAQLDPSDASEQACDSVQPPVGRGFDTTCGLS
jgi:hypothetical protein